MDRWWVKCLARCCRKWWCGKWRANLPPPGPLVILAAASTLVVSSVPRERLLGAFTGHLSRRHWRQHTPPTSSFQVEQLDARPEPAASTLVESAVLEDTTTRVVAAAPVGSLDEARRTSSPPLSAAAPVESLGEARRTSSPPLTAAAPVESLDKARRTSSPPLTASPAAVRRTLPSTTPAPSPKRVTTTSFQSGIISPLPQGILSMEAPRDGDTAVCIVGGIRSFYYSKVHTNILHNAIDRLRPARVFFVLNTMKRLDLNGHGSGKQVHDALPMKRVYKALAAFQPSFVELYRRSGCDVVNETEPGRLCCDWEVGSFMQLHWVKHCFEEVQRYEADYGIRFGLYVRLRPDVFYYNPFPAPESLRQSNITLTMKWTWDQPADWLFIVTRRGLLWFEDAYETLSGYCREKRECLARLDSLSGEGKQACLKPNGLFDAPEYSSWYRQNPRGPRPVGARRACVAWA